jgi:hypothetical protein
MNLTKERRQAIIDGYLAETGSNLFHASAFVDWLSDKPDHEAYQWFYGSGDEAAAREHRINLARRMASGLRIVVQMSEPTQSVVQIKVREFPAYVSPMSHRRNGGGYQRFDPSDADAMAELRAQGQRALQSWLVRYGGAFNLDERNLITQIAAADADRVAAAG